ncbi:MAG: glycosyltransferase family 4 protein [Synergistota bacterium]|nr:glycosyltransferase family 4 protein [Synergistota bacterium]
MRVKYLAVYDGKPGTGVTRKILSQALALNLNGVSTDLVLLSRDTPLELKNKVESFTLKTPPYKNTLEKISFLRGIAQAVRKYSNECDIIYFRGLLPSPFLSHELASRRKAKVVFEIQSIEEFEARMIKSWFRYWMTRIYSGSVLKYCDGIVGVTDEITNHYYTISNNPGMQAMTSGNGVCVADVPLRKAPEFRDGKLDLLCVGKIADWHGIDRLIKGMAESGTENIRLHIVGEGQGIKNLIGTVQSHGLEERVIFHGFKTGNQLDSMFDKCHIGIGSLGIHRKGLAETAELKVREYCARGFPFINSASDKDFPPDFRYRLQVPPGEGPVDVGIVRAFAEEVFKEENHPSAMRSFALEKLDWKVRMKELAGFFEVVLSRGSDQSDPKEEEPFLPRQEQKH